MNFFGVGQFTRGKDEGRRLAEVRFFNEQIKVARGAIIAGDRNGVQAVGRDGQHANVFGVVGFVEWVTQKGTAVLIQYVHHHIQTIRRRANRHVYKFTALRFKGPQRFRSPIQRTRRDFTKNHCAARFAGSRRRTGFDQGQCVIAGRAVIAGNGNGKRAVSGDNQVGNLFGAEGIIDREVQNRRAGFIVNVHNHVQVALRLHNHVHAFAFQANKIPGRWAVFGDRAVYGVAIEQHALGHHRAHIGRGAYVGGNGRWLAHFNGFGHRRISIYHAVSVALRDCANQDRGIIAIDHQSDIGGNRIASVSCGINNGIRAILSIGRESGWGFNHGSILAQLEILNNLADSLHRIRGSKIGRRARHQQRHRPGCAGTLGHKVFFVSGKGVKAGQTAREPVNRITDSQASFFTDKRLHFNLRNRRCGRLKRSGWFRNRGIGGRGDRRVGWGRWNWGFGWGWNWGCRWFFSPAASRQS